MRSAVLLSAVRTPIGRHGGELSHVRPDDLAAIAITAAVERSGVEPGDIEDVYFGCANQAGEDNRNVARMAALLAGLPESVAGVTVNRLCASGLSAIVAACHAVLAGDGDLFVAGGVESMSRAPLVTGKPDRAFPRGDRVALRQHARLAIPEPGDGGAVPAREHGRDGRERGRALRHQPRGPGCVRPALAAPLGRGTGGRALRRRARRRRGRRDGRAPAPRHLGRGARQAAAGVPARRHGHGRQLERHQRRRGRRRDRERGASRARSARSRSCASRAARSPASTRA